MQIDGRTVALVMRHSSRRSFALQVDHRGARVAVPHGTPVAEAEQFIRMHGRWLLARLDAQQAQADVQRLSIGDRAEFPLLGRTARLRTNLPGRRTQWRLGPDGTEELWLPASATAAQVVRALRVRAIDWFRGRVEEYCHRLGLPLPDVRLSAARTRWGSCSSRSGIRLHWRLIHLEPALIDYVVAHEVAHLLEMNHSPRFWSVVERLYPGWQDARRRLRVQGGRLPLIDARDLPPVIQED
ncbi:MAG: SprT family zinc-dependent metalloprotease [Azoarcus sp.]|jgi:predicted metal-dependent hydrolase|nr:M48 family metallopeptidase [Azoarcus sp.]MDD2873046.1 SprT family zinc-dependent metalloprotease [Azoarcus sp.]MDX9836150.1 SprT family zinc-dependent metalloprotease [Azoarcus sp.]